MVHCINRQKRKDGPDTQFKAGPELRQSMADPAPIVLLKPEVDLNWLPR